MSSMTMASEEPAYQYCEQYEYIAWRRQEKIFELGFSRIVSSDWITTFLQNWNSLLLKDKCFRYSNHDRDAKQIGGDLLADLLPMLRKIGGYEKIEISFAAQTSEKSCLPFLHRKKRLVQRISKSGVVQ